MGYMGKIQSWLGPNFGRGKFLRKWVVDFKEVRWEIII